MDSRRHKKAGYPLHMKGATDTFSFKPTVITYNEANIAKLAHIRMDFAGIMQTIGIKGRYVGFTYIRPLYGFAPFWRS